jgi:hypothetical protein
MTGHQIFMRAVAFFFILVIFIPVLDYVVESTKECVCRKNGFPGA